MKSVPLNAFPRALSGRGGVKKLRTSGRIPAVIYGGKTQSQSLEVDAEEIGDLMKHAVSENVLVDLAVKDDARSKRLALVQEMQHHPLSGALLHVDLHEVAEDEKATILVPLETTGEPVGVKTGGGVLEHIVFKIKVRALPKDLPEQIVVDVTSLEIGKSIHLGEIKPPAGVEILGDKKVSVISVAAPRTEEEEAATTEVAATAAGDVEMTKEKKEEGAEGAAPVKGEKGADKAAPKGAEKVAEKAGDKKSAAPAEKKK